MSRSFQWAAQWRAVVPSGWGVFGLARCFIRERKVYVSRFWEASARSALAALVVAARCEEA